MNYSGKVTQYEILNTIGKTVKSGAVVLGSNLIQTELAAGVYFLKAGNTFKKVVIE